MYVCGYILIYEYNYKHRKWFIIQLIAAGLHVRIRKRFLYTKNNDVPRSITYNIKMAVDLLHGLHEHTCCLFRANLFQFYYWKHLYIYSKEEGRNKKKLKFFHACKVSLLCLLMLNHLKESCNL